MVSGWVGGQSDKPLTLTKEKWLDVWNLPAKRTGPCDWQMWTDVENKSMLVDLVQPLWVWVNVTGWCDQLSDFLCPNIIKREILLFFNQSNIHNCIRSDSARKHLRNFYILSQISKCIVTKLKNKTVVVKMHVFPKTATAFQIHYSFTFHTPVWEKSKHREALFLFTWGCRSPDRDVVRRELHVRYLL